MKFRLAMAQILVVGGQPAENLARACDAIETAARTGCQVVVLPECLDLGWTDPSAATLAEPLPGQFSNILADAAARHGQFVVAGLVERADERCYNSAVLISPDGDIILQHRKINELDIALDTYSVGNRLGVVETPYGIFGVNICADNFEDSLAIGEVLARMGAQVILSPCAWAVDADHDQAKQPYGGLWLSSYSKLSQRFNVSVVGVSSVGWIRGGPWSGRKVIGCSLAMGASGKILATGPYGDDAEAIIMVEIEPQLPLGRGSGFSPITD